ncbi:iron ABC transporter permease [Conexibacter sp. SYSU D00693]|uniref:FecCD family ABC transporter permease n=1 Tax=Conexibacter sp. SYSU D00693 TaxID=2812560 RepID=UPI00196B437A|nr:iron ABC transporter permease [Conexibacter sp. SYSU D00693]
MAVAAPTTTPSVARPRTGALLRSPGARTAGLAAALVVLLAACAASLAIGSLDIPLREVWEALVSRDDTDAHAIVHDLRIPRTELGVLVGGALGAAGALMQGVTRNPLAEPQILGINSGAALSVVAAISVLGISAPVAYAGFALLGAALASVLVYLLGATGRGGATPVKLALAGAVLTALLTALTSAILVFDAQTLDEFRFWIVGSIAGRDTEVLTAVAPFMLTGLAIALLCGRSLNALAMGDEVARSLGHHVDRSRGWAALGFVLLAGGAVAAAGPIGFVGLTVPHVARALVGPDYRWVIPFSIVLGATLLLVGDVAGRVVSRPDELEVGIITALIGAPFFIWLVRRRRLSEL